jgi:NADH-quinone oxidoreductase subunit N
MTPSLNAIVPMACVTAAGIAAMVAESFRDPGERMPIAGLGVVGLLGAAFAVVLLWNHNASSFGVVAADNFGLFVTGTLVVIGLLSLAISGPTVERERLPGGEYYALMLFATAGMMLMATATDLLVIFLALEVMSLAVYVLTGIRRDSAVSTEAAFKYFLLGAFSSAFFLYGIAFTYGLTGSTRLDRIGSLIAAQAMTPTPMMYLALGLLLVGFAFKVAAVPFHMWTPDAYEGAPPAVTAFMSTGVKAAAFAAFVRVFLSAFEPLRLGGWSDAVAVLAGATMIVGTVAGVTQSSVKRLLAYSSIGHGGYLLLALVAGNDYGKGAVLFYLLTYAVTNIGAFGVIALLDNADRPNDQVKDYAGLWNSHPSLAVLMTIFLLSLGGFPPMAGFIAKWYVFSAAVKAGYTSLAIIGVLTSVVSVFFYLRIVVMMYMTPSDTPARFPAVPKVAGGALVVSAIVIFYLGILPTRVLEWAAASISTIF